MHFCERKLLLFDQSFTEVHNRSTVVQVMAWCQFMLSVYCRPANDYKDALLCCVLVTILMDSWYCSILLRRSSCCLGQVKLYFGQMWNFKIILKSSVLLVWILSKWVLCMTSVSKSLDRTLYWLQNNPYIYNHEDFSYLHQSVPVRGQPLMSIKFTATTSSQCKKKYTMHIGLETHWLALISGCMWTFQIVTCSMKKPLIISFPFQPYTSQWCPFYVSGIFQTFRYIIFHSIKLSRIHFHVLEPFGSLRKHYW